MYPPFLTQFKAISELHFLCFKASPSVKPFMWKLVLFTHKFWFTYVNRTNFHTKGFALGLYLKQWRKGLKNCLSHAMLHHVSSPLLRLEMSLHQRGSFSTSYWKICAYKVHNSFCNKKPDNSRITSILLVLFSYWTYTYTTSTTPQYMWLSTDNFIHMQWFLWLGIHIIRFALVCKSHQPCLEVIFIS